ncbi:hypothetical protein Tco_0474696 [Tanacetum coccineum]
MSAASFSASCHLHFRLHRFPEQGRAAGEPMWSYSMEVLKCIVYGYDVYRYSYMQPDEHEFLVEEQPLPPVDSPTAESPVEDEDEEGGGRRALSLSADSAIVLLASNIESDPDIQQCKVQEVQSSVTSSGDETSSGIVSDEEIDKQELEAHYGFMAQRFRKSYCRIKSLLIRP